MSVIGLPRSEFIETNSAETVHGLGQSTLMEIIELAGVGLFVGPPVALEYSDAGVFCCFVLWRRARDGKSG